MRPFQTSDFRLLTSTFDFQLPASDFQILTSGFSFKNLLINNSRKKNIAVSFKF